MAALLPETAPEAVRPHLAHGEQLVSSFGPYHATSSRIILISAHGDTHEMPYISLERIAEVQSPDHRKMFLGFLISAAGLAAMFFWYLVIPIIALVVGMLVLLQGAVGRPAYYQLEGRGMDGRELRRWQIRHYGAGSFIASISEITGIVPVEIRRTLP